MVFASCFCTAFVLFRPIFIQFSDNSKAIFFCSLRDMSKFARSTKNCEKLEKWQFLLKSIKTSVRGGRRVPSKNCDSSTTCEIFELVMF